MSQEMVQRLRDVYSSSTLEEAVSHMHPTVEMLQAREIPDAADYRGRDELMRGTNLWLEEWDDFQFLAEDFQQLEDDRVFMRVRLRGHASRSGIDLDRVVFHLWTFRDGLPWRCEVFFDKERALEAAGLEE